MRTYEVLIELDTGYTLQALEAAATPDEARNNLYRKLNGMGWREGKRYVLGTPRLVTVTLTEHDTLTA